MLPTITAAANDASAVIRGHELEEVMRCYSRGLRSEGKSRIDAHGERSDSGIRLIQT
jgi:hypothetical protein